MKGVGTIYRSKDNRDAKGREEFSHIVNEQ